MSVNDDVLAILTRDLGPSAPAFLNRQAQSHLGKAPAALTKGDLDELAKWCFTGVKLILDEKTAERVRLSIVALK